MTEQEMARWQRTPARPAAEVVIPAQHGIVEVNDGDEYDAETVAVSLEKEGGPVDAPDDPITVYGTILRARDHERQPIVPAWLRNKDQRREFARWYAGFVSYVLRFHAWKLVTRYAPHSTFWAVVGVGKLTYRQICWFWVTEQYGLRQAAANSKGGAHDWRTLNNDVRAMRKFRGAVLAVELLVLLVLVLLLRYLAPWWVQLLAVVAVVPFLASFGRPADKPILVRVTNGAKFVRLTADQVRTALCAIGIPAIKTPADIKFPQDIAKDGPGWLARINLPAGVEAVEVLEKRGKLSSALRLPVDQVWPSAGPDHAGQMDLWVGYQPSSKMGQPRWSLASPTARTSVFEPAEFATDERQRPIRTTLFEINALLGGQPGSGKSYAARTLATIAILDPICEVKIAEFKGTGDFMDMAELCTVYVCGVDDQAFASGEAMLAWALAECERRGKRIEKAKKRGEAPEGKVTPELAARPGSGLHPVFLLFDEVHELFGASKNAAKMCERAIKRGRALNIIIVLSTQIPDKDSLPPIITRCVTGRWCLAVQDQVANDMILGTGSYKRGLSATVYRPKVDAGWGIVNGLADAGPARSHYPDPQTTAAIIARATELRGGRVVGGADDVQPLRDILADVLHVMSERGDHWEVLASKLAELDTAYDGWTPEMVSSRLRQLEIPSVNHNDGGTVRRGARREHVIEAINRRALTAG